MVTAIAVAALATGTWARAQDSGNGAAANGAGSAPATQQSQEQGPAQDQNRAPTADHQQRPRYDRQLRRRRHVRIIRIVRERGPGGRFGRAAMRRDALLAAIRLDAPMLGAFRQLNLSDSQRESVRTILRNARNAARQGRGNQARAAVDRQDRLALRNPGDPNYARAVEAVKSRAVARIERATRTQQALYNVLTPAQKTQLTQIFAQRRARLQQRNAQPPGLHG